MPEHAHRAKRPGFGTLISTSSQGPVVESRSRALQLGHRASCGVYRSVSLGRAASDALKTRYEGKSICGIYIHLAVTSYINYASNLRSWRLVSLMYIEPIHLHC